MNNPDEIDDVNPETTEQAAVNEESPVADDSEETEEA